MLADITKESVLEWVTTVVWRPIPGDRNTGRVLLFGPARTFSGRGAARCRLDFDIDNDDQEAFALMVFRAMERYSDENQEGYVWAVGYRTAADAAFDDIRGRAVKADGDEGTALFGTQNVGVITDPYAAAGRAMDSNTKIALKLADAFIDSMKGNVELSNHLGRIEGQLAEAARAQTIQAQAEMAATLMPSIDNMVQSFTNLAALHYKSKNGGGDVGGEQPDDLGEERMLWNISLMSVLLADAIKHGAEKADAFTPKVKSRMKELLAEVEMVKMAAEAMDAQSAD